MASTDKELRRQLGEERGQLAEAMQTLRGELGKAASTARKIRATLPVAALGVGALATLRRVRRRRR